MRQAPVLEERRDYTVRLSNGKERILWNQNGSIIRPSATTPTAGHGKTLDLAIIDEAFAHTDLRVDQSFGPPMLTRPEPQTWIVSTAGTWESVYFNAKRAAGRGRSKPVRNHPTVRLLRMVRRGRRRPVGPGRVAANPPSPGLHDHRRSLAV